MTYPQRMPDPLVGAPLSRVDGPLKVTGAAHYAADNPVPKRLFSRLNSGVNR